MRKVSNYTQFYFLYDIANGMVPTGHQDIRYICIVND